MAPQKVPICDTLRYQILNSLALDDKVPDLIEVQIKQLKGPPKYISPHGDLPVGTVSEILDYRIKINGWRLVKAHQYRLPDGSIRGGPDPLYICIDDAIFVRMPRPST
jgi:hypothetical protein